MNTSIEVFDRDIFKDERILKDEFVEIRGWLIEIYDSLANLEISNNVANQIIGFTNKWFNILSAMNKYNVMQDGQNGFKQKAQITLEIMQWHESITSGFVRESGNIIVPYNFFPIYNWAKSKQAANNKLINEISEGLRDIKESTDFEKEKHEITTLLKEAKADADSIKAIANESRLNAADRTFREYATIFNEESQKYSLYEVKLWPFKLKLGSSEWWLVLSLFLVFGFLLLIVSGMVNKVLPVDFKEENAYLIAQVFTRLVAISIWIYLITFTFKQFSIARHLATTNRHRANALNSYKLFIETIDKSDQNARNALMLTVAKAIYDQAQTGYLSNSSKDTNSVVEMTKFVTQHDN